MHYWWNLLHTRQLFKVNLRKPGLFSSVHNQFLRVSWTMDLFSDNKLALKAINFKGWWTWLKSWPFFSRRFLDLYDICCRFVPPLDPKKPTDISMGFDNFEILKIDDKDFTVEVNVYLIVKWKDSRIIINFAEVWFWPLYLKLQFLTK